MTTAVSATRADLALAHFSSTAQEHTATVLTKPL